MQIRCAELKRKKPARLRRAQRTRARIIQHERPRLIVCRSNSHIYAQITDASGAKVFTQASTIDKELKSTIKYGGNKDAATLIGKAIAARALAAGIKEVVFDRSGFAYHGRVKALADAAREAGLEF